MVEKYESKSSISGRLFSYCTDRKLTFVAGTVCAILNGFVYPIFSIFAAKMFTTLVTFDEDPSAAR